MSNQAAVTINSFLLFGRKKKQPPQAGSIQEAPPKPKPKKLTGLKIAKYEVAEGKVKFSNTKGLFKKRWVIEKEFPLTEITSVETQENWINLTWSNQAYQFKLKSKSESFAKLQDQIQTLQTEQKTAKELNERAAKRKADLLSLIDRSLPIVDASFDILIGLHAKRVDWHQVETCSQTLGASFSYKPVTLPSLDLDFAAVDVAVKSQVAKDTSKETLFVLKAMHGYFTSLKSEDDLAGFNPNFEHAKSAVLAYYTLNDLLLAKVVGEKDSGKEVAYLEEVLKTFDGTSVNVDLVALLGIINGAAAESERDNAVFEVRALFREQLKQL
jgi:hypothetical protein